MGAYVKLSTILRGTDHGIAFRCPGCDEVHVVNTKPGNGPVWDWNGDVDKPTVSPSIQVTKPWVTRSELGCHSYVREGRIEFLSDCKHALAGQTVNLPPFDREG